MSDTFDAVAHAAGEATAAPAAEDSAPQAATAETQAEDTAPPASAEPDDDASQDDAAATPSRSEKRIKQLLERERELRERLAFVEGRLQRDSAPAATPADAATPTLPPDLAQWVGEEPKPETFPAGEFDPQYLRAIARYEARNEQAQLVQQQRAHAQRQAAEAQARAFAEQAEQAAKAKPDLREVVGGLGQRLADWQANLLAEAGIDVAYAVGKDADAEARIRAARSPLVVAREIGRIEARLERARETPIPQPTAAPEPPARAVRGGNVGSRDPSKMSMSEYAEYSRKHSPWARSG